MTVSMSFLVLKLTELPLTTSSSASAVPCVAVTPSVLRSTDVSLSVNVRTAPATELPAPSVLLIVTSVWLFLSTMTMEAGLERTPFSITIVTGSAFW